MKRQTILNIVDANIGYQNADDTTNHVISDLNLKINKGDCVSLLGISGCGKSTILHAVCGFIPLISGNIKFPIDQGHELRISIVFQESTLFPWLTVEDNILYGDWIGQQPDKNKIVNELLEDFGLPGINKMYPRQLSGGMKQRVDIARAMANNPAILILDEPFGQLDYQNRIQSQNILIKLLNEKEIATLFVTHNVEEAINLSDHIYVLGGKPASISNSFTLDKSSWGKIDEQRFTDEFIEMKKTIEQILFNEFLLHRSITK